MRALVRTLASLVLLAVVPACVVGPNYHRPSAPASPAFKEAPPDGWKLAQPADAIPRGAWWQLYALPELNGLEQQVSVSNQNVLVAIAQYREARDQIRIARSALFPTVSVSPLVGITQANPSARTSSGGVVTAQGSGLVVDYSLPVDFSYQFDVWGSVRRSVTAASATAQASQADLANVLLMNQAQLAQTYFQLHGLDGDAALLQTTLQLYEQSLQLTKDRMQAGVASGADVAQAQAQYDSTRAQWIDVGVARAQYEHAIAVLAGKAPSELTIPASQLTLLPPPVPIGVPSELLERRPDISGAERRMAAANEQIGIAQSAFYPTFSLNASGGFASTTLAALFTWPSRFWAVAPTMALTLFDAGKRRAQVDVEEAAYDATVATYRQTVLTTFQQVEDQLAALRILEQEAAAEDSAVKASLDALDIANEQYKAGTVDYLQVITTQTTALTAQRTALDILTRRLVASVLLIEALGGGWTTP
ncbi:MAG TPA: efflux transporter outer membrane subunit [Vicinamibacterales bacterium]|nr:efflux transporter outer membrane subunit [Vicinamibacterales bacterium]